MSTDRKRPPHKAWEAVEKMALDDEARRVASLGDEALDRELAGQGMDPQALRARGAVLAAQLAKSAAGAREASGSVAKLPAKAWSSGARSIAWIAVAALAAGVVAVVASRRPPEEAIGPDIRDAASPKPAAPSPAEVAAKLRDEAVQACEEGFWASCERKLDEAQRLDPAGEAEARVLAARHAVSVGLVRDGGGNDKPARGTR